MNKVVKNAEEAIQGIKDDMTLMVGGFGLCGCKCGCGGGGVLGWCRTCVGALNFLGIYIHVGCILLGW